MFAAIKQAPPGLSAAMFVDAHLQGTKYFGKRTFAYEFFERKIDICHSDKGPIRFRSDTEFRNSLNYLVDKHVFFARFFI